MRAELAARLRRLPKIDGVLARADVRALQAPRWAVLEAVRAEVEAERQAILASAGLAGQAAAKGADRGGHGGGAEGEGGGAQGGTPDDTDVPQISLQAIERRVRALLKPSLSRVINATGVIVHTNLGRAPLAAEALARVVETMSGYTNLEYDLAQGRRGSRHAHLATLLTSLTGAGDAVVVNNNAAAVMLCLAALATGGEVIVSRGELVEIGGSFRIPDVMRLSGARLVEVGTTNKTRVADYRAALGPATALLLKVHRSNFAILGFTEEVAPAELGALGRDAGVATMMDLGSGSLFASGELRALGLEPEPGVAEIIAGGVDVVCFSGDKLLGGPQAGIICGRADLIKTMRSHPLMRALRPDKLTLVALEATLSLYRDGLARSRVPVPAMLAASPDDLRVRAESVLRELGDAAGAGSVTIELVACQSTVGGGAMPLSQLASWGLCIRSHAEGMSAVRIERELRGAPVPVIGRIVDDRVILDMRTIAADDVPLLVSSLRALL